MFGESAEDGGVGTALFRTGGDFDGVRGVTRLGDLRRPLAGFDVEGEFHDVGKWFVKKLMPPLAEIAKPGASLAILADGAGRPLYEKVSLGVSKVKPAFPPTSGPRVLLLFFRR